MNATVQADFGASWYAGTAAGAFERPRLTFDIDVDVCVIGGGLAGLTAAREVARRGWSVAVLEAKRVAWSASGRNCGVVMPGFGSDPRRMVERIGIDLATDLWKLSEAGLDYVRTTIRDTGMPGVRPVSGWLDVCKADNADELRAVAALLKEKFGAAIEAWPTERVRAGLKSDCYFQALHYPDAFHIDPLNYAHGLANAALAAGAAIFEESPALEIDPAGVRKRITTPSGRVRAAHIVLAGNAHLDALVPRLAETVLPVTSYVAVTAPLGERLGEAISYKGAVSDTRLSGAQYRIVGGDRLMWAGGVGTWPPSPRRAVGQFASAIARTFPQLGAVEIEHAWSGVMGFSVHGMPQVGEVIPGLWLASGFGGHGLNTTAMAGELIAGAITDGDDRWRLFLPYELVWAGGTLGRAVHHVATWARRGSESWAASLSRRREAVRRAEAAQVRPEQAAPPQVAPQQVAPRPVAPRDVAPQRVAPREVTPREVAPRPVTPPQAAPRQVALPEVMPAEVLPPPVAPMPGPAARPEPAGVEPSPGETAAALVPEVESLLGQVAERANRQTGGRPAAKKGKTPKRAQGAARNGPTTRAAPAGTPGRQARSASPSGEAEPPAVSKDPPSTD
jgi:glycine/D-amino acid oxidase-like deaminating enzyme